MDPYDSGRPSATIAPVLKALSDENRLMILLAIADRDAEPIALLSTLARTTTARPAEDLTMTTHEADKIRSAVQERYADAARNVSSCCGPAVYTDADPFGQSQYDEAARDLLPAYAVTASLGCGNPTLLAALKQGDVVLDLGSGGGIDVLLSARRVAPDGKAYGLDMTPEMPD